LNIWNYLKLGVILFLTKFQVNSIRYTKHGERRAAERGVNENMILKAVSKPDFSFYDLSNGATVVFRKLDGKDLLVVCSKTRNEVKVITTFITSDAEQIIEKKLESNIWVRIK